MDGSEKLKFIVIGKFEKPRCFKNVLYWPAIYRANKKQMTGALFIEWVRALDRKIPRQKVQDLNACGQLFCISQT